jgi:hypothetical protein
VQVEQLFGHMDERIRRLERLRQEESSRSLEPTEASGSTEDEVLAEAEVDARFQAGLVPEEARRAALEILGSADKEQPAGEDVAPVTTPRTRKK